MSQELKAEKEYAAASIQGWHHHSGDTVGLEENKKLAP